VLSAQPDAGKGPGVGGGDGIRKLGGGMGGGG